MSAPPTLSLPALLLSLLEEVFHIRRKTAISAVAMPVKIAALFVGGNQRAWTTGQLDRDYPELPWRVPLGPGETPRPRYPFIASPCPSFYPAVHFSQSSPNGVRIGFKAAGILSTQISSRLSVKLCPPPPPRLGFSEVHGHSSGYWIYLPLLATVSS